ncbi:hypothetical protein ACP275_07G084600 [Erythranthe tilingii]
MEKAENMFGNDEGSKSRRIPNNYGMMNYSGEEDQQQQQQHEYISFFNSNNNPTNWDNLTDQNDPFESALSSMVSSPTASIPPNGENIVLRELIGRLGSICNNNNSGDISPQFLQQRPNYNNSTNTSCYSTPLNSPPKLNLFAHHNNNNNSFPTNMAPFSTDPAFAERAARYSSRVSGSNPIDFKPELADSRENSSVSDQQIPINIIAAAAGGGGGGGAAISRKRKSIPKGKGKETPPAPKPTAAKDNANNVGSENSESSVKRNKSEEEDDDNEKEGSKGKDNNNTKEAPKDYIHVRARRGQATDAHSLAERVRREKISERMKFLQDLVPGCNKVTGKAVMLDEIINYVQSLQRQVEFLSMKLATVNPRMDINVEALMSSKDMFQSRNVFPSDGYPFQSQPNSHISDIPSAAENVPFQSSNNFNAAFARNQSMQLPPMDNFTETASQVSTFWEDDLHSVVQMEFTQNQSQFS